MRKLANTISYKLSKIKYILSGLITSDRERETIWIVGDGRSGSTWLQEMINYDNRYKCLFEPFHPTQVDDMKEVGFYRYMRPDSKDEYFYKLASKVFSGEIYHPRVIRENRSYNRRLLIKDIYANLFVKWACAYFPHVKKIMIIRHPFATALSKQKLQSWDWLTEPRQFLGQKELLDDYLGPFEEIIRNTEGYIEQQVLIWSIIHYVALGQLNERDILLVFYEELCSDPEKELMRIFSYLYGSEDEQSIAPKLLEKIKEPSFTSRRSSAIMSGNNLCDVWRNDLSDSTISRGLGILKSFGLDSIYNENLMPNRNAAEDLLKDSGVSRYKENPRPI